MRWSELTLEMIENARPDLVAQVKARQLAEQGRLSDGFLNYLATVAERIQAENPAMGIADALEQAEQRIMAGDGR